MWNQFDDRRRSRQEESWTDVMQVCENGHLITRYGHSQPNSLRKRCAQCGAATITDCPQCNAPIPGHEHMPGMLYVDSDPPPSYCDNCGAAFPWTKESEEGHKMLQEAMATKRIFVVHGHDEEMKQATARTLSTLGLEPIILHEQANEGKTLIEKFEKHADAGFAVVLLSPDDMAYAKDSGPKTAKPRARQNVILELGYFAAKLGRARVFPLYRERSNIELPSDIAGVIYTPYDRAGGGWRFNLAKELKACGYDIDANRLM